jgi:uncharacterized Tic20 family protein
MTEPPNPSWDDTPGGSPAPEPNAPPPGAYPPPAPAVPPVGYPTADDKTWALVAHYGGAAGALIGWGAGGWVAPLIALLVQGNKSPVARAHAVAALNFQIPVSIVGVIAYPLYCVFGLGILVTLAAIVVGVVFGVIAGMRANEGQLYQYPFSFQIVK